MFKKKKKTDHEKIIIIVIKEILNYESAMIWYPLKLRNQYNVLRYGEVIRICTLLISKRYAKSDWSEKYLVSSPKIYLCLCLALELVFNSYYLLC